MAICSFSVLCVQISTIDLLNPEPEQSLEGDQFVNRQCIRRVSSALKKYFESHLFLKVEELRRSQARGNDKSLVTESPPYKVNQGR